jgi:hypothetical protein
VVIGAIIGDLLVQFQLHPGVHGQAAGRLGQLADVLRGHLHQVGAAQVLQAERPEHVVDDRVGHLDVRVALHHAPRLEGLEGEGLDVLLERHPVLEALGDGDGEAPEDAAQGGALLGQVDEQLAERAVVVLAGAQEHLVASDLRLLGPARGGRQQEPGAVDAVVRLGRAHTRGMNTPVTIAPRSRWRR